MKLTFSDELTRNLRPFFSTMPFLVFLGLLFSSPWPCQSEVIDRVVATVNNEVITLSELDEAVALFSLQMQGGGKSQDPSREKQGLQRRILEELINKKLVEDFAVKSGIQASNDEVDQAVKDVLSLNRLTEDRLKDLLARDGLTYDEYRAQLQDQIVKAKLIHREVRPNINVSDDSVREYYLNHPEEFTSEPGVVLKQILFRVPANADEKTRKDVEIKASQVREGILKGVPFEDAARQYSEDQATAMQGGMLGFLRTSDLIKEFRTAIGHMKEGEVSEPIRTSAGYHLLKLDEQTTGTLRPFDKVKDDIRSRLYEDQGERYFQEWIRDLRKNAHIEILL